MKIRSLLTVVAMLSVFLLGIGTAQAVVGVPDDVPGSDIVIPIICEGHIDLGTCVDPSTDAVFGSLNTLWAIAETSLGGGDCSILDSVCTPDDGSGIGVVFANVFTRNWRSGHTLDTTQCWSKQDIISDDCQSMIKKMSCDDADTFEKVINGVTYFVGYTTYVQAAACDTTDTTNRLISWVYLTDNVKGFSTGFNGIEIENGIQIADGNGFGQLADTDLNNASEAVGHTAHTLYPRIAILNSNVDTFNWWIILAARNQLNLGGADFSRVLSCSWCNEDEFCVSKDVGIPDEMNIINVGSIIPGGVFSGFPKFGFAYCVVKESGNMPGQFVKTSITGTLNLSDDIDRDPETYSIWGWSYQRGVTTGLPVNQKLAVAHPIHRTYCGKCQHPDKNGDPVESDCDLPTYFTPNGAAVEGSTTELCTIKGPTP